MPDGAPIAVPYVAVTAVHVSLCGFSVRVRRYVQRQHCTMWIILSFSSLSSPYPSPSASGMSVMEMSHRGKEFLGIARKTEADLRALLNIPDDYAVLFLQVL